MYARSVRAVTESVVGTVSAVFSLLFFVYSAWVRMPTYVQCAKTAMVLTQQEPDAFQCTKCVVGYGPTWYGTCITCSQAQTYCQQCLQTNAFYCTQCYGGYGPNSGVCTPCADSNCITCNTDYSVCTNCITGYGVLSGSCVSCIRNNCLTCITTIINL